MSGGFFLERVEIKRKKTKKTPKQNKILRYRFHVLFDNPWFYLRAGKNLAKGATKPPEKAWELMYTGRWSHINTTHDLYELRKAGDRADRWKLVCVWLFMYAFCNIMVKALCIYRYLYTCVCVFLTIDWPPITGCPSLWFLHALAGGHREATMHSTSLCCRWVSPHPGGEKLAWGIESLRDQRHRNGTQTQKMCCFRNYYFLSLLCVSYPLLQVYLRGVWLCWWRVHSAAPQQTKEGWETAGPTETSVACVHPDHVLLATEKGRHISLTN